MTTPRIRRALPGVLLLAIAPLHADEPAASTDLFLAGGSLATCSDLSPRSCSEPPPAHALQRTAARFAFDAEGIGRATEAALWTGRDVDVDALRAILDHAVRHHRGRALTSGEAGDALDALCVRGTRRGPVARPCGRTDTQRPWRTLLADERSSVLAAFELPQLHDGRRTVETAHPALSREQGGNAVMATFVAAAAERAGGRPPRIAVVTASAWDSFDPVDFYLTAFHAMGADTLWWPVDAALNRAVFEDGHCRALDLRRMDTLGLPGRGRVYPDLVAAQQQACEAAPHLAQIPFAVDGIFFAGGDQWRLRRAFFDADDRPNDWLRALREAHASGRLVVGGTSAGAAVQSGAAMLSNGTPTEALRRGAIAAAPPAPGCTRAGRCPDGLDEDSFTFWPAGGTGLATDAVVDTHFSERARELRLLVLMRDSGATLGYGADETSALRVRSVDGRREVSAFGRHGGWVFSGLARDGGTATTTVFYLSPTPGLDLDAPAGPALLPGEGEACLVMSNEERPPTDALADGALRAAARWLAPCGREAVELAAGSFGSARLSRLPGTRVIAHMGHVTIGPLRLEYAPTP